MRSDESLKSARIMIVDIDSCLLLTNLYQDEQPVENPNADMLCSQLIDIAKNNGYAGFYVCTHRNFEDLELIMQNYSNHVANCRIYGWKIPTFDSFCLHKIIPNFGTATGLTCLGVSIWDDLAYGRRCGDGYQYLLRDAEINLANNQSPSLSIFHCVRVMLSKMIEFEESKNKQLQQIFADARSQFDEKTTLEFHYFDDRKDLGEYALKNLQFNKLPRMSLRFFHHDPEVGIIAEEVNIELGNSRFFAAAKPMPLIIHSRHRESSLSTHTRRRVQ